MTTIRLTYNGLIAEQKLSVSKIDDKYIQIMDQGKSNLRVYYTISDGQVYFYYNDKRFYVTDPESIPAAKVSEQVVTKPDSGVKIEIDLDAKPEPKPEATTGKVRHNKYEIIKTCIQNDIPVYLHGEAGTGKNYTLQEIAQDLQTEFYFTNSVQQEYKITGFVDAGGEYHETEFYKAFTLGGLFFLDEIDASIPEVLVLLNAAIANRYFEFPNGRQIAHPDFRVVAAGNTMGSGADELYTGRLVLDQATLDRFVIVEFDYDRAIELTLCNNNEYLVNFVRTLRKSAKAQGIRATFSYRCIMTVHKLEKAGIDAKTILEIAVFKGMNMDTVKTFKLDFSEGSSGKYYYSFRELTGGTKNDDNQPQKEAQPFSKWQYKR